MIPKYIFHYYDKNIGPFKNLSDLSIDKAKIIQLELNKKSDYFASLRGPDYISIRFKLENELRNNFISIGGMPIRKNPHYFTLGKCDWLLSWYPEPKIKAIDLELIPSDVISFTYGDLFPAMRFKDNKPYSKKVYRKEDLIKLINNYGLPQNYNSEGIYGPKRYIEAQLWDDEIIYLFAKDA